MRTERIDHSGLTHGVLVTGEPAKPSLALLHGWPQSKEVYDLVIDDLASDSLVLAFDLPAMGDSRGAPNSAGNKGSPTSSSRCGRDERGGPGD